MEQHWSACNTSYIDYIERRNNMERYYYETVLILKPSKHEDKDIFKDMCQEFTGTTRKIKVEDIGEKRLAYPMERESKTYTAGYYVVFTWEGTPDNVSELERCMRINDNILKFITLRIEDVETRGEILEPFTEEEKLAAAKIVKSEQPKPDALDVLLGFAKY